MLLANVRCITYKQMQYVLSKPLTRVISENVNYYKFIFFKISKYYKSRNVH